MPLHKVEELCSEDFQMTGCLVILLIKRWIKQGSKPSDGLLQKILGIVKRAKMTSTDTEAWPELRDLLKLVEKHPY